MTQTTQESPSETHFAAAEPNGSAPHTEAAERNGAPAVEQLAAGSIVEGSVSGITHFGAFVNLDGGATGLIHISEIAHQYVRDVREHLRLNDRVRVKVLQMNPTNGKFDLSLKQLSAAPPEVLPRWGRKKRDRALPENADPAFEEKLSKFMKSSEERQLDVRRNIDAKRGRGRFR